MPVKLYRIWSDERVNESLRELRTWSYGEVCEANEWLDALDDGQARQNEKMRREAQRR